MFKRILVPLDGSGRAEQALPIAARLARASGGSIFLVRVVSTEPASLPSVLTSSVTLDDDIAQGIIRVAENGGDGEGDEMFGGCDCDHHDHSGVQWTTALD